MGGTASRTDDPSGKDDVPLPEANDHPESPPPLHALDRKPSSSLNNFTTTEFIWNFGGHSVYVTGAWDDWRVKAALSRTTPTDFTAVLALPIGTFQYKFIVDGTWKHNPALPTQRDPSGNLNNVVVVSPQVLEYDSDPPLHTDDLARSPMDSYNFSIFPQEDHTTEPPALPRMLTAARLDRIPNGSVSGTDFVRLNHVFETNSDPVYGRDVVATLAAETRYKSKVVTTILIAAKRGAQFAPTQHNATSSTMHTRVPPLGESQSLILDALNNV